MEDGLNVLYCAFSAKTLRCLLGDDVPYQSSGKDESTAESVPGSRAAVSITEVYRY